MVKVKVEGLYYHDIGSSNCSHRLDSKPSLCVYRLSAINVIDFRI